MKKKVTITAEDKIGRTESITLVLSEEMAALLIKAADEVDDLGEKNDYRLSYALNDLYETYKYWRDYPSSVKARIKPAISKSQYYRLRDFYDLIYHKFYKYTLSISSK